MILSMTVCLSHAHAGVDANNALNTEISISIDTDKSSHNSHNENQGSSECEISCNGCCVHHALSAPRGPSNINAAVEIERLMPDTALYVSDVIDGLKRPPRA
tara:strand:+ start:64659 stop:64964 length:306 start_codon:yes stop_codon:yes gene_type:complete